MLIRDVQAGLALHLGRLLSQCSHEFVEVGLELFLNTVGPLLLSVQLWHEVGGHLREKVIKWVILNTTVDDLLVDAIHHNGLLTRPLNEERDLVLIGRYF